MLLMLHKCYCFNIIITNVTLATKNVSDDVALHF